MMKVYVLLVDSHVAGGTHPVDLWSVHYSTCWQSNYKNWQHLSWPNDYRQWTPRPLLWQLSGFIITDDCWLHMSEQNWWCRSQAHYSLLVVDCWSLWDVEEANCLLSTSWLQAVHLCRMLKKQTASSLPVGCRLLISLRCWRSKLHLHD